LSPRAALLLGALVACSRRAPVVRAAPAAPPPMVADAPAPPAGCALEPAHAGRFTLRFDLLGYLPGAAPGAVLLGDGTPPPRYRVCDLATGRLLSAPAAVGPVALDARSLSGARLVGYRVDLGAADHPGRYTVVLEGAGALGPVTVDARAYDPVVPALVSFLRSQRCGATTLAASGHAACHRFSSVTDGDPATRSGDGVAVPDGFVGAVDERSGPAVDVEGGWHDAGDYVKFLGTAAFVAALDLLALRDHPRGLAGHADALLDEVTWGVDWIERMVTPAAPLHQVSGALDHEVPPRRPEDDTVTAIADFDGVAWSQRPAFRIDLAHRRGGNVLGRAAAALALWSSVATARRPGAPAVRVAAVRRLALARRVYALALTLERPQRSVPPDFYPEQSVRDDLALAAAVLAASTGEDRYRADALAQLDRWMAPDNALAPEPFVYWGDVSALALAETARLLPPAAPERGRVRDLLAALVAPVAATRDRPTGPAAAFGYALPSLGNGSVAQATGAAVACLVAESVGAASGCRAVAAAQAHWVFGRNPFGLTFVAGLGPRSPRRIHHDLARVTGVAPLGAVVGGPSSLDTLARSGLPAPGARSGFAAFASAQMFYDDVADDYVTNETAIDFTPALLYLVAALVDEP
jgi:hypothetical protein